MLQIKNINKKFPDFWLQDISIDIQLNDYWVLLGPSGSGKTMLLELLAGIKKPLSGNFVLNQQDITCLPPEKRHIGLLYQDYQLFNHMTVYNNIAFSLQIKKQEHSIVKRAVDEIAVLLNISHLLDRYPKNLSGGEKQRVALARALVMQPQILLLDEPFASIDAHLKKRVIKNIRDLYHKLQLTVIHVTHDIDEALYLANKIAVMHNGKVLQQGKKEEVFKNPKDSFVADFLGYRNIFKGTITDQSVFRTNGLTLHLDDHVIKDPDPTLLIPPESIIITQQIPQSSARNHFSGTILEIIQRSGYYEVILDIGIILSVYITHESIENLGLAAGQKTNVLFKATALKVF